MQRSLALRGPQSLPVRLRVRNNIGKFISLPPHKHEHSRRKRLAINARDKSWSHSVSSSRRQTWLRSADILKRRSISTQLTFKRRLPKICQYKRMWYLPTIRSQMVTDQNLTGLKCIRKRPPLQTNYLIKCLQGGRSRSLESGRWRPV